MTNPTKEGNVRMYEPVTDEQLDAMRAEIRYVLQRAPVYEPYSKIDDIRTITQQPQDKREAK